MSFLINKRVDMATAGVLIFQRGPKLGYPLTNFQNFRLDIFIKSFYEKSNTFHLLLNTYFRASSDSLSCGSWVFRPPPHCMVENTKESFTLVFILERAQKNTPLLKRNPWLYIWHESTLHKILQHPMSKNQGKMLCSHSPKLDLLSKSFKIYGNHIKLSPKNLVILNSP